MSPRKQLKEEIKKIEEELNMPYIIPWERTAERRGKRKGLEEGIEMGKKETALRMLGDGLSIEVISKYTGLPTQEIEKLMSFIQ